MNFRIFQCVALVACTLQGALCFSTQGSSSSKPTALNAKYHENEDQNAVSRRGILSKLGVMGVLPALFPMAAVADGESESFASIAARANQISKELETSTPASEVRKTDKTIYDFSLPIEGTPTPLMDIIKQKFESEKDAKVKAVLVVNIKQDDPVARKNIPELISLVTK